MLLSNKKSIKKKILRGGVIVLKKKRTLILILLISIVLFCTIYIFFAIWIAKDARNILRVGLQNDVEYKNIMHSDVYKDINPLQRHLTYTEYTYEPKFHEIETPLVLHFFGYAKVWVKQRYAPEDFGFEEPVTLTMKLKKGEWYATNVHIEP
ncbi:hypothetical protein FHS16_005445 [Paenibacillus endophyticus]|uniref:DUF3139 domain-containing protein n=1 Tax=Paenibacillus endophyticus TaxID=1294268 RepID=A0A7W5GDQ9_9BACL|nr:hypothetical protein [Paenibacillus endophyticus]MBB3155337.1 hypothetical protein [Paenibacillus endophyticus]